VLAQLRGPEAALSGLGMEDEDGGDGWRSAPMEQNKVHSKVITARRQ